MFGLDIIAKQAEQQGDPELALRAKLTNAAFECSFGMMNKAWTGWDDNNSGSSADSGMGCFLSPLESTVKVLNDELMKGVEDLYKSLI
ncbi:MAG: hypothetical protein K2X77_02950 [Candidatus Obscuribacterales bacterium]|nr:hypothetical protein [Candidatus Obscuribacterales bacterium]